MIVIFINSAFLQSKLTEYAIKYFAKHYNIELSVDNVYLKLPKTIVLQNVKLLDENKDTLVYSDKINAKISAFHFREMDLRLEKVSLINPYINVKIDSLGISNYESILEKFSSKTEKEESEDFDFSISCNNFEIINAKLKYKDFRFINDNDEFNYADTEITGFNIDLSDFKYAEDTLQLKLNNLEFAEKSGLNIKKIAGNLKYYDTGIELYDFVFKTKLSKFVCSEIILKGDSADYLSDPLAKANLKMNIDTLIFNIADLGPVMPEYRFMYDKLYLSGNFNGNLSKFKFNNFNIKYGENTSLATNIDVDGLNNPEMAFIFGNINKLQTSKNDINKLLKIINPLNPVILPSMLNDFDNLSFNGNITGFLSDLVAYGEFKTSLGSIRTDIAIVTDFESFDIEYDGKLDIISVDAGKIIGDSEVLGKISMNSLIAGSLDSLGNYKAKIKSNISELEVLKYKYTDININGDLSNTLFNGEIFVDDPNLKFEFIGQYALGGKIEKVNFSTDLYANLNALNITKDSLNSELKLTMYADVEGPLSTKPLGNLTISNLLLVLNGQKVKLNHLNLDSYLDEEEMQCLKLNSDYLDLNFIGDFEFDELGIRLYNLLANYAPSFIKPIETIDDTKENIAKFDLKLKNVSKLIKLFMPDLVIDEDIFAEGNIYGKNDKFDMVFSFPVIKYDSIYLWGSELNIRGNSKLLNVELTSQELSSKSFPWIENIVLNLDAQKDSLLLNLNWNNFDDNNNSGNINILTKFSSVKNRALPKIESYIYPSNFIVENRNWEIKPSSIIVDDKNIVINKFAIMHENQILNIDGEISEDPTKLLRFLISDVDITNFNPYIAFTGYQIQGTLSGNGRVANIYDNPSFKSSLSINDFKINNEDFGRFDISALWEGRKNGFKIDGVNKFMKIRGIYLSETDSLDLNFLVDNFNLEILEPYTSEFEISDLKGNVDIVVDVRGQLAKPDISGYIEFQKAELVYDFLKLKAFINDKVFLTNNAISFQNFEVYDEYNNKAIVNGGLYHKNFGDIKFDFLIDATKMKLMNTTEKDNSLYYGTAFATGNVRISGDLDKFGIDVVAKTEPNTVFVLPMTDSYEGSAVSYVTYIQRENEDDEDNSNNKHIGASSEYYFKLDAEITPDAEAQIVFDSKVGDLIRGFGSGNLKMEYTSDEEFYMYGDIEIVSGDYLFTLENIINKKFHIKPGGTIVWSGDAYDAQLDLDAVYYAKAPLIDLMSAIADSSNIYKKPTSVECHMHMSGSLMAPDIKFSISIPNANDKVKTQLANMTQDEINKQMLYLLILNRFYNADAENTSPQIGNTTNAFGVTSAELLSNQLSNWLSQMSKDFDIGINYRPGSEVSERELEVALSTTFLNDRLLINGNVGVGENKSSTSNLIGDIEVQLKVNQEGSFRFKGFTRANPETQAELGPYTSGVGVFYTEDFDSFGELFKGLWNKIIFKKARERKKAKKEVKLIF
ncbi:MAG: hypothetical protein GX793_10085 [Bacteroidales bacterium]|nr:translocation/assembly module TamB domain-containing protein [Bacteroidales bacterium]NLB87397.1 hypothetical protein [Bacteroidales bacterium]